MIMNHRPAEQGEPENRIHYGERQPDVNETLSAFSFINFTVFIQFSLYYTIRLNEIYALQLSF